MELGGGGAIEPGCGDVGVEAGGEENGVEVVEGFDC